MTMSLESAKEYVKGWVERTPEHRIVLALYVCLDEDPVYLSDTLADKAAKLFPEEFEEGN